MYHVSHTQQHRQRTIVVGQEEHLQNAKRASDKVQQNIPNAPAFRTFTLKVKVCLEVVTEK